MGQAINIFIVCFLPLFLLGIFVPYANDYFNQQNSSPDIDTFSSTLTNNGYLGVLVTITNILFWNFGLNAWINLLLLTPIRLIMAICLWYIIAPTK
jgi:hypothetical protein